MHVCEPSQLSGHGLRTLWYPLTVAMAGQKVGWAAGLVAVVTVGRWQCWVEVVK